MTYNHALPAELSVRASQTVAGFGGEHLKRDHVWLARRPSPHLHKGVWIIVCQAALFARYGQGQEAYDSRHFRPAAAVAWFGFPPWASTSVSRESCGCGYILGHASRFRRSRYGTSHMAG